MTTSSPLPVPAAPADIAIIGIGCRFPGGARTPSEYWRFLIEGRDAIREVPADRWSSANHDPDPTSPGRSYAGRGGFLDDPSTCFDAAFFGISPREAETMDPQQRLLLEVSWEALEDAGLPLPRAQAGRTGVFVGGFTLDSMLMRFQDLDQVDSHTATSSSMTLLSNRISYAFDLKGPSMTIDTACSSSLVATHLAAQAVASGECELALAGGVNLMLLPNFQVVMCKGRFLAADGRSKAFDASADGYGRGEGAGVVVLKRLDAAIRDGDRIHAVIAGTGVNQDGTTDGIAQPNGRAQEALIRSVCARFALDPARIGYIEAHGTGTALGDPTEVGALGAVYGRPAREDQPRLGSVKASIGHLEAAAGVAGLIKASLAVQHRAIPPQRLATEVNPGLSLAERGLRLPEQAEPWPDRREAWAAVNSFGYGGTNAHAVLVEPPPGAGRHATDDAPDRRPALLLLSARGEDALHARANQLADMLEQGAPLHRVAATLAWNRTVLPDRAAVPCRDLASAIDGLRRVRSQPSSPPPTAGSTAWIYSGMGPQWAGMGRGLTADPAFQEGFREAMHALARHGLDLREAWDAGPEGLAMERNDVAQPCNFALQVGLTCALRRHGLAPAAIIGHSTGEMAAAWAAGALDLSDAALVVAVRARLQQEVAGGSMLAAGLGEGEVEEHLRRLRARHPGATVEVAAINSPTSVTVAGDRRALDALREALEAEGTFCRPVRVEVAYHSAHMDPIEARLRAGLRHLRPKAPTIPLWSTVEGAMVDGAVHDADYWWRNTRGAVRLQDALASMRAQGHTLFVQVGPHPVLAPAIQEVGGAETRALACLVRGQDEATTFTRVLGDLWEAGQPLDLAALVPPAPALDLPPYPWQRRRYWRFAPPSTPAHPLLASRVDAPEPTWVTRIDGQRWSWLRDHRVAGAAIVPGAMWIEALLAAAMADVTTGADAPTLEGEGAPPRAVLTGLRFPAAMGLADNDTVQSIRVRRTGDHIELHGRLGGSGDWSLHAEARCSPADRWAAPSPLSSALHLTLDDAALPHGWTEVDPRSLYTLLDGRGLSYGPAFQGVRQLWCGADELLAWIDPGPDRGLRVPPSALDSAFQALLALRADDPGTFVPVQVERLQFAGSPAPGPWTAQGRLRAGAGDDLIGDLRLVDAAGVVFLAVVGLRCRRLATASAPAAWWHAPSWQVQPDAQAPSRSLAAFGAHPGPVWRVPEATDGTGTELLAALLDRVHRGERDLLVVTRRAWTVQDSPAANPAHAALWGMARVVMTERPQLGLRLLDVDEDGLTLSDPALRDAAGEEEESALRGGQALAGRILRCAPSLPEALAAARRVEAGTVPARLVNTSVGSLEGLRWVECPRQPPGPGRVEVRIEAASLNFKDVMKALGLLGAAALEDSYLGTDLGMEAVGTVLRAGAGVDLAVGQRVLVYAGGVLRTHAEVDARFVLPCPEGWTPEQASSFFVTATAWHALVDVGHLRAGETVLIHSAAGGVGLAAVGIARALGARVITTAGTERKRQWLRDHGVEHVFDSRTLDFGDAVLAVTSGRGVDVVLNALAGPAIEQGLSCLAPGGRFLELGKKDLSEHRVLALGAFNRRVSLTAIDLDRAATEDPDYFPPLARAVLAAMTEGRLPHLPARSFAPEQAVAAFRALAGGDWIGKVVLTLSEGPMPLHRDRGERLQPRSDRSWLVTGGLSGFGLTLARALVDAGARHLVLASRSGAPSAEDARVLAALSRRAEVALVRLDAADAAAVDALVARIQAGPHPLEGVVHAAATYDDRPLDGLSAAELASGMAAKAVGALNLHRATQDLDLRAFILCSSIAAQLGNPGQAVYAAANTFLDGLAELRQAQGQAGTAVALGALAGAGQVARDKGTAAHLRSLGLTPMPGHLAAVAVLRAAAEGHGRVSLVDLDWQRWARAHAATPWRRLEGLLGQETDPREGGLLVRLLAVPASERLTQAQAVLLEAAAPVFGLSTTELDPRRPLREHGLDSLMAVELATALRRATGVEVSAMDLLGGRSLTALAERLLLAAEPVASTGPTLSTARPEAGSLRGRICVVAPYEALGELRWWGERLTARVQPVHLPGEGPLSSAELGRHLAILGSMALSASQPSDLRHAYPVHSAELELVALDGTPVQEAIASAEAISLDPRTGLGEAETALHDLSGRMLGRMRVRYHVMPMDRFRELYARHARSTPPGPDPYRSHTTIGEVHGDSRGWCLRLPPVQAADCLGHFDGLPALPVSILGRYVFDAVAAAARLDGKAGDTPVARARLQTHRFVWAGEQPTLRVSGGGARWRCEVWVGEERAADFELDLHAEEACLAAR